MSGNELYSSHFEMKHSVSFAIRNLIFVVHFTAPLYIKYTEIPYPLNSLGGMK